MISVCFTVGWRFCLVCHVHPSALRTLELLWNLLQVRKLFKTAETFYLLFPFHLKLHTTQTKPAIKFHILAFHHFSSPYMYARVSAQFSITKELWNKDHWTRDCKWTSWIWEKYLKCLSHEHFGHLNEQHGCGTKTLIKRSLVYITSIDWRGDLDLKHFFNVEITSVAIVAISGPSCPWGYLYNLSPG